MTEAIVESHVLAKEAPIVTRIGAAKESRSEGVVADAAANARAVQYTPVRVSEGGGSATVVIDRRVLIRDCLVRCLKDSKGNDVIQSFSTVEDWMEERPSSSSGLVIVLCSGEGTEAEVERDVALLLRVASDISIVILSDREDASSVLRALDKGARGYITTSMAFNVAVQAIRLVRAGGTFVPARTFIATRNSIGKLPSTAENSRRGLFTARQLTVVESLRQGKSNKVIAYELNMCESTVKVHVRHIMKKLGAKNRTEVAILMNGVEGKVYQCDLVKAKGAPL